MHWHQPAIFITLYEDKESSAALIVELERCFQGNEKVSSLAVQRRYLAGSPVEVLWGELPNLAHEAGLKCMLSLDKNQNHGFFPDMQPRREWLRKHSEGKRVLNLFSHSRQLKHEMLVAIRGSIFLASMMTCLV